MKCIIVDDEPLAIEVIESHIDKLDDVEIVAKCSNALSAFGILQKEQVDLIFLDIQMPKLTGIDFLKTLRNPPKVIFTTAYREFALESYDLNAVDYLLKPISFDRLLKAIGKVYEKKPDIVSSSKPTNLAESDNYFYVKADKKMVKIELNEVLYIESLKDYVRIKTKDRVIITHQKISYLEEKLPESDFLRVHRSYLIAIGKVDSFSASTIEIGDFDIPIGRNYKNQVIQQLGDGHQL